MKRKILSAIMALVLCMGLSGTGRADMWLAWNDALRWDFDESTGCLTISGTGDLIVDGETGEDVVFPWENFIDEITEVVMKDGVTWGSFAGVFDNCSNLTHITIPKSMANISTPLYSAVFPNPKLQAIYVEEGNPTYYSIDGVLCQKGEGAVYLVRFPGNHPAVDYTTPEDVTFILSNAFENCTSLASITVSDSVTRTGDQIFANCSSLRSVTLPDGIQMGSGSMYDGGIFKGCSSLTSISIPEGVTHIGANTFRACTSLTSIHIPQSLTSISDYAFGECDSCTDIYYAGSEEEWKKVSISSDGNDAFLAAAVHYNSAQADTPAGSTEPVTASPTSATVLVNGENFSFDAYNIGGANFFKLRDLAYVLSGTPKQFDVSYDTTTKKIALTSGQSYTAVGGELASSGATGSQNAAPTPSTILLDGQEVSLTAYLINGSNYFMLRDIGHLFDFAIGWDGETRTIAIDTSTGYAAG